jgi:hypothetical protein
MKKELNPAVVATVIIVLIIVAAVFIYRGANSGVGTKAPGETGNAGPFAPGSAVNKTAPVPPTNK